MGRKATEGLVFFPVDINMFEDDKMLLAQELVDPDGKEILLRLLVPYIAIQLLRDIYKTGCYIEWNEKICRIKASSIGNGVTSKMLDQIIGALAKSEFFDEVLLNKNNILTGRGIQKRWLVIMKLCRRSILPIKKEYCLIEEKPEKFKKSKKSSKIIVVQESGIVVQESGIVVAEKVIDVADYAILFPFNNKSIDYKGKVKYIGVIKRKKEEKGIVVAEKPIVVAEKPIVVAEKPIVVAEKPIVVAEKPIVVAEKPIKLTKIDLQVLANMSEEFRMVWEEWINYAAAKNKLYDSLPQKKAAIEGLVRDSDYDEDMAIKMIRKAMANNWINFYKPKDEYLATKNEKPKVLRGLTDADVEAQKEHYKRKERK